MLYFFSEITKDEKYNRLLVEGVIDYNVQVIEKRENIKLLTSIFFTRNLKT